jgi:hypothetical protein
MKQKELIIGLSVIAAGIGAYFLLKPKTQEINLPVDEPNNNILPPPPPPPPIKTINKNLLLKQGSKGDEVKELQKLLGGLTIDGIFGNATKNRLFTIKGVSEITLNNYNKISNVNINALKTGTKIMAYNNSKTPLYKAELMANGEYLFKNIIDIELSKGKEIGIIEALVLPKKEIYLVSRKNIFGIKIFNFVYAKDVKKI